MRGTPLVWLAGAHEAEEVARLLGAFRDHLGASSPDEQAIVASVRALFDDPATDFLLAALENGAAPCGVAQLRYRHSVWTSVDDCWLEDLFVEAQTRGCGVGKALVLACCERARERGCARIELDTSESNQAAIKLYETVGFSAASKSRAGEQARDLFMGRVL